MKKTVKICIYNKSSSKNDVLLGNGDAILDNICLECKVHENIDGTYEIDAEFIIDNEGLWQHIEEEAILKVRLDYGYEYFRITQPRKTSNRIIVYGRQVTIYETMHLWLTDVRPENRDGAGALNWILDNATGIKELEVMSDIKTISTAYYMDMNMYEALHDCDQSFFNRWGGEIQRRGYTLRINQRIGTDRGVEIRSRKNLTGFEANTNIDNVVTRIKPKGFDGITIDGYVDSEYINKYPRIKTKEIKYEDVKLKDENNPDDGYETLEEARAELIRLAKLEYSEKHIDVITAEYNISFVDLSKTEEYKEYVQAERVYLGDTVNVYEEKLDINVSVRAIDRVYDVLGERVEEIKLSNKDINKLHSMNDILTDILKGVQENDNSLQLYIQNIINSGIQDSYVFYNKAELVICDSPEIENAINVWRFNRGGLAHSSNGYSGPYNVAITYDGKINADMILAGLIKGNYIDARNLTVIRADGTKTLEITAGGDVNLNVNSLKIQSSDAVTNNNLISSINMSPEEIKINASQIDMTGSLDLCGTFKCYADNSNKTGNYLHQSGAMHRGYLEGQSNPTFSSGIWNPDGTNYTGYVSVGYTNADHIDENGCLWMSPQIGGGCELIYSKLLSAGIGSVSGILYNKDGSVEYKAAKPAADNNVPFGIGHTFDTSISTAGNLNVRSSIYSKDDTLIISYGDKPVNTYAVVLQYEGYMYPMGNTQLGTSVNPWYCLLSTLAPQVVSDKRKKKNIQYIDDNTSQSTTYSLRTNSSSLTKDDMYNFIRDNLKLATYEMVDAKGEDVGKTEIGFIAQDIIDTKVGKYIINDSDPDNLVYDMANRVSVLEGALQIAIKKIEELTQIIKESE